MSKHRPTPAARRVDALRYQAERLMQDAQAWGFRVYVTHTRADGAVIQVIPCTPTDDNHAPRRS